ncbi:MAG: radical SAM protein [Thermodesulfobacteriota bacterium]
MPYIATYNLKRCKDCGACREIVACSGRDEDCIGCGACALACPHEAIEMVEEKRAREVTIQVNGKTALVPERIPVKEALGLLGYPITALPQESGIFAPCGVGACFSCAVEINGVVKPACVTGIKDGMNIKISLPEDYVPRRIVSGFMGHMVGGVGTPWQLKAGGYIEVACFAGGCNLRCPQCQNWAITYGGKGSPLTPKEAAHEITSSRRYFGVDRMAISGGECTLNRPWLIQYIKEIKVLNPDRKARFHVDTNGSLLTPDYIDDLLDAGMTDIGIDLKALEVSTFQHITGLKDKVLAQTYMDNAWNAVHNILKHYKDRVFLGIGIPYNKDLISKEEIRRMGEKICVIDPEVQVCVLDYRGEFRSGIKRPTYGEMVEIYNVLKSAGLDTVICQTTRGHIGP